MSSSFSSASSSSSSLFSYAYACVAASLFSASFGHTFWRPWTAFFLHFGSLWAPLEPLWAPLGTTWATMLTQGWKWLVRAAHRANLGSNLGYLLEQFLNQNLYFLWKLASQNNPTTKCTFYSIFLQFQWSQDPDFWALACTGAQFSKNHLDS